MNERKEWAADWDRFEEIAEKWDKMHKRLGDDGLAALMMTTKAYRAYDQRWPFDNMARWSENTGLENIKLISSAPSVEEEVADRLDYEKLVNELTPRQKLIYEALRDGQDSVEIEVTQGYNSNGAVRWHKHQIKKKVNQIRNDEYDIKFEFVCRDCGNIFDGDEIDPICQCGSSDCLFLKSYTKPR